VEFYLRSIFAVRCKLVSSNHGSLIGVLACGEVDFADVYVASVVMHFLTLPSQTTEIDDFRVLDLVPDETPSVLAAVIRSEVLALLAYDKGFRQLGQPLVGDKLPLDARPF